MARYYYYYSVCGQTLKIWLAVPFGVAISAIHFWKADILGFMKNLALDLSKG